MYVQNVTVCERKMSLRKEFIVESEVNRTLRMAGRHEEEKPLTLITRELRRQLLNVTLCWMDAPAAAAAVPPAPLNGLPGCPTNGHG